MPLTGRSGAQSKGSLLNTYSLLFQKFKTFLVCSLVAGLALGLGSAARADEIRVLTLGTNGLGHDPVGDQLYVSFGSGEGARGNSLTRLDPVTGALGTSIFVGSEPERMAISGDGQYAYVYLAGSARVRRVHLPSQTADLDFALGDDGLGSWRAEDMEVVPGQPNLLMVTMYHPGYSPRSAGTAVYDDGVRRPDMNFWGNGHTCHSNGQKAYIFHNETTGAGTWEVGIGPNGLTHLGGGSNVLNGFGIYGKFYDGLIYANNSTVYDPESNSILGQYTGGQGVPIVDSRANRVFYLTVRGSEYRIVAFDRTTFLPVGYLDVPGVEGGTGNFVPWGADGFAFRTATQVFLIRTSLRATVLSAPTGLTATARSSSEIELSWTDRNVTNAGFRIERKSAAGSFVEIATTAADARAFTDTGLTENREYTYRIRAFSSAANSAYSNEARGTTLVNPPVAPAGLTAVVAGGPEIAVSWAPVAGATGFRLERSTDGADFVEVAAPPSGTASYRDRNVAYDHSYRYRVRAYNIGGPSGYSNVVAATTPPAPPTVLSIDGVTRTSLVFAWEDRSSTETGFAIERKRDTGDFVPLVRVGAGETYYRDTGLEPNTRYTYRVYAFSGAGDSPQSGELAATTLPNPPPTLASLAVEPGTVAGGRTAQGTVRLTGAAGAGGVTVSLSSNNRKVRVPATVAVAPGSTSATFTVSTSRVPRKLRVTLTARVGTVARETQLLVSKRGR